MVDVLIEGKKKTPSANLRECSISIPCVFPYLLAVRKLVVSPLLRWASVTIIYPPEHSTFRGVSQDFFRWEQWEPRILQQMIRSRDDAQGIL